MRIFKVEPSQLDPLLVLARSSFSEAFEALTNPEAFQTYVKTAFEPATILAELRDARAVFHVVEIDGQWAGYSKLRWDRAHPDFGDTPVLEMQRLYISQKFIGQKVGAALMQHSINFARQRGDEWIWLLVWYQNHSAIAFYERWGFEAFARKDFQFGTEVHRDIVMRLKL